MEEDQSDDSSDAAAMQRSKISLYHGPLGGLKVVTYKPPSQKIMPTAIFLFLAICRVEITGKGRHRTRKSREMLVPTWARPSAAESYRSLPPFHD